MSKLPPLATTDDIVARLGRSLTDSEALKVEANLRDSSIQVRKYCNRVALTRVTETITVYINDRELQLPGLPIHGVTSVVAKGDPATGLPDLPITWYRFDGIDKVFIDPELGWVINLPEVWIECSFLYTTFDVTIDHGFDDVPDDVLMVVANAALGAMTAPNGAAAGLIGESIGPYAWHADKGGAGIGASLSKASLATLSDYRNKQGTVSVRFR
jgi:hypothetical protein